MKVHLDAEFFQGGAKSLTFWTVFWSELLVRKLVSPSCQCWVEARRKNFSGRFPPRLV